MKIELDFTQKTIEVRGSVPMNELIKKVKSLGLDLKEWKLKSEPETNWYPVYPHTYPSIPTIWYDTTDFNISSATQS